MSAEKYLEGNYDGDFGTKVKQAWSDCLEAIQIEKEAKQHQKDVKENETKRILGKEEVTDEDISKLFQAYTQDETLKQYLVDGAVLKCSQATLQPFLISDGTRIALTSEEKQEEEIGREYIKLKIKREETDDAMSVSGLEYATIDDCKRDINIEPFRCNCLRMDDREDEYLKIKADSTCAKEGVCKHLMQLEDHWENLPINNSFYKTKDIVKHLVIEDGEEKGEDIRLIIKTPCITMTSMLFCRHGGLITPVTSGQTIAKEDGVVFTKEELIDCGWEYIDEEEVRKFNDALKKYGVISRKSALILVATMLSESNCENITEGSNGKKHKEKDEWPQYKKEMKANGTDITYEWGERGAGYIQITWRDTHLEFLESVESTYKGEDTAGYIGNEYPIEASVWYWTNYKKTGEGNLNSYVEKHEESEGMFLITQYFVNSYKEGIDPYLREIRDGADYEINKDKNMLEIDGKSFELPNGWERREGYWKKAEELL